MPKLRIISAVVIASLALAVGVAMAANTQTITKASGTPLGNGSAAKPLGKTLKMTFEIENADDPTQRPVQTEQFSLAAEGVVDFGKQFPKCKFSRRSSSRWRRSSGHVARPAWAAALPATSPARPTTPRSRTACAATSE